MKTENNERLNKIKIGICLIIYMLLFNTITLAFGNKGIKKDIVTRFELEEEIEYNNKNEVVNYSYYEYEFYNDGKMKTKKVFGKGKVFIGLFKYYYDDNGFLNREEYIIKDNKLQRYEIFKNDKSGNIIEKNYYNSENQIRRKYINVYDDKNRKIIEKKYNSRNILKSILKHEYINNRKKILVYNSNEVLIYFTEYNNINKNELSEKTFNKENKLIKHIYVKKSFNLNDKIIKKETKNVLERKGWEVELFYDKYGNIIEKKGIDDKTGLNWRKIYKYRNID